MNEKPKILITDDSEINRALLKEILGDGYDYLEAEDGAAAVELMRQRTDISLLLLDLMMPGMDGFDVLRVMKYHAWLDEIPVIVISATEDTANCWVSVKQFSKNDTATACQDWLRSTRLGRGSIKSHVHTVKVLGMGLFAYRGSVHLYQGVTH